jgi:hypothetical protein
MMSDSYGRFDLAVELFLVTIMLGMNSEYHILYSLLYVQLGYPKNGHQAN